MTGTHVNASYVPGGAGINKNDRNKYKGRANQWSISVFGDAFLSVVQSYQSPIDWFPKREHY